MDDRTKEYYGHLSRVQNHDSISNIIDIMTITGFMDFPAKLDHLERYAEDFDDTRALRFVDAHRDG